MICMNDSSSVEKDYDVGEAMFLALSEPSESFSCGFSKVFRFAR